MQLDLRCVCVKKRESERVCVFICFLPPIFSHGVTKEVEVEIFKSKAVTSKVNRNEENINLRFSGCPVWGVRNAVTFCQGMGMLQQNKHVCSFSPAHEL